MSRNKWELIINEAFELGCNSFVLTGGEPFLNPHFFDILEVLNQKMPYIEINTNGTLINDEVANKLSKYPISSIEVSLYGYDQNSTFEYTKSKSAFKRVFNAISCLKKHNLPFTIKYVQNKFNENGTDHIVQLLREQNIQVKLTGFKLHADVFTGNLNNPQVDIESQHNNILLDEVLPCYPSVNGLALDPEGEVRVCPKIKVLLGNLVNSSLKDIWKKSLELRKFRLFWAYYCAENMMYIGCYQKYICPATQILSKENGLQNFLDEYLKWCNKNDFAKNN